MKYRIMVARLGLLALTAGLLSVTAAPAAAADPVGPITGLAGKCVDVPGAAATNGLQLQLWTCTGGTGQSWTVGADGTVRALGKCLDVNGGVNADGTKVQLWDCTAGNTHQRWSYNATSSALVNPETGRCLDATGQSSADGTKLQLWACNGQTNQRWTLPGAPATGSGPITGLASGRCVDLPATANGTQAQLLTCNGGASQTFTPGSGATLRVLGKCLDVNGGVNADGTKVQLWDCTAGNTHQQWAYSATGRTLVNPETGKCLDAAGQGTADGTKLQLWSCNGQANQQWTVPDGTSGPLPCTRAFGSGERTVPVTFNGTTYQVTVYVPTGVAADARLPLVLNLHGTSGTGSNQLAYSELKSAADAGRFLVAAPNGAFVNGSGFAWNVPGVGNPPGRDDVAFLAQVIATMTGGTLCADRTRVYLTGYSGGGRMTSAFACARPDLVAAIAPVAGLRAGRPDPADPTRPEAASCQPTRAVPVIAFHGQQDATNPYAGGGSEAWRYSVPVAAQRWAALNTCGAPVTTAVSAHVSRIAYPGCRDGADVQLYTISDGGHTWPGTAQASPGNGNTTREISANTLMWQFFQRFRLP
ncbi:RICIN domain-containing protein [Catellatospora sp. KI3]|uniref:extracellular catalytic domain type 1 short-chain-length polyhydroxyalkanoate depolymerase n=1 Tax=Catellatospora sp. KI3 TaxID=3041620 RepID=UPI0024822762|nr:ricin-type beta-trefoil lectin domain protein [Catellatospora sp. KI3]MDI1461232.1 RICIN domain-containing protein [Catellatospora sp. KI3]